MRSVTKVLNLRPVLDAVREALAEGELDTAARLIAALHPADGAELLDELNATDLHDLFVRLEPEQSADVLAELDWDSQIDIANTMSAAQLSGILSQMEPDDAADMLAELTPAQIEAALAAMSPSNSAEVRQLLAHDEESAGGLMNSHVITLRDRLTAQQAIDLLRQLRPEEESIYYLFVTDAAERLVGVVSLRSLVMSPAENRLAEIMDTNVVTATVETDQEECARLLARYDLLALPVIDAERRIVGVVTADDIIDVIEEEATEDMYRLANLSQDEDVEDSLLRSSRRRLFWLFINLPTALLASFVVSQFEATAQKVIALASFMPVVAGMGGNAGIQTLTLIVRSIALGEVATGEGLGVLVKELGIGIINGLMFGLVVGLIALAWVGTPLFGVVVGLAMLANLIIAPIAGTLVPLTLKFFGIDPALASGVMVTTVTDVTGYTCLFGLATFFLAQLS